MSIRKTIAQQIITPPNGIKNYLFQRQQKMRTNHVALPSRTTPLEKQTYHPFKKIKVENQSRNLHKSTLQR
ncbi:MAG: hypothetical protein LBJ00_13905 [Planctomycetaceae bacterium]|nr:hypothetical protein [Planctomycetaceae bacterium]